MNRRKRYKNIERAISFAMSRHYEQSRKVKESYYFWHVFGVARLLDEAHAPEEVVIAGILHDLLEDTDTKEEEIEKMFGKKVLDLVKGVSISHKDEHIKSWEDRKKRMIEKIKNGGWEIKLIKLMDVLDNAMELWRDSIRFSDDVWKSFNAPKEKQKWYYYTILEVIKQDKTILQKYGSYIHLLNHILEEIFN